MKKKNGTNNRLVHIVRYLDPLSQLFKIWSIALACIKNLVGIREFVLYDEPIFNIDKLMLNDVKIIKQFEGKNVSTLVEKMFNLCF
jgi:hypothetical protein